MKYVFLCILSLIVGLAAGIGLQAIPARNEPSSPLAQPNAVLREDLPVSGSDLPETVVTPSPPLDLSGNRVLLARAMAVLSALKEEDYTSLSAFVHPKKGVDFTPYSTVDKDANMNFSASGIAGASENQKEYIWGITDGKGDPIRLTISDYFDTYVFNEDYTKAPVIGIDRVIGAGNTPENVAQAYPDGRFVEFHFPGLAEENQGFDWCSLKLVFEEYGGDYKLVGVIHSQWTI